MTLGIQRDPISGAIRSNIAATGAKRYGTNASGVATTGAVSKIGYIDREKRKRARNAANKRIGQMNSGAITPTSDLIQ